MKQELRTFGVKLTEFQSDKAEHMSVIEVLQKHPEDKRTFRMIGEALVESTVKETLPKLQHQVESLSNLIEQLNQKFEQKNLEIREFMQKYNLKTPADKAQEAAEEQKEPPKKA